jgi:hypothetical protein
MHAAKELTNLPSEEHLIEGVGCGFVKTCRLVTYHTHIYIYCRPVSIMYHIYILYIYTVGLEDVNIFCSPETAVFQWDIQEVMENPPGFVR